MTTVLITGANGFVGCNLRVALARYPDVRLLLFDLQNEPSDLEHFLAKADVIYHLAGVNRPQYEVEFVSGNVGLTETLCATLQRLNRKPKIIFSSSIQAALDNPYGRSKRQAEEVLRHYADETGAEVVVYRFRNLFGKWSRPNYNSVVATFCYNIARDLPITISDPTHEIELVYIDDAIAAMVAELTAGQGGFRYGQVECFKRISLGELASMIRFFRSHRETLILPDLSDSFARALYATYLSYLPRDRFAYSLALREDERGKLAELLKSLASGQIFISRTRPGATRGNHYHDSKVEKFVVLEGEAIIRLRHILDDEIITYRVSGEEWSVVDIPPGYTHSIENIGHGDLIVLFWASEIFDPAEPDTYYETV